LPTSTHVFKYEKHSYQIMEDISAGIKLGHEDAVCTEEI
jgi:hypothetical protein